ncbi:MAG: MFS transporter [Pseudomonadota bacterium]
MAPESPATPRARRAWVLFDFAQQPFHTIVTTFVFGPYFASHVAATSVEGQALWGYATAAAGAVVAIGAPIIGAVADTGGRLKAWIAALSLVFCLGSASLWIATPGGAASILLVLLAFAAATAAAELKTALTNAMMPGLAGDAIGRLSGTGWGFGYVGGLISLAIMLIFFVADPVTGTTLVGLEPAFGLSAEAHEGDRLAGPFSAVWYLVFVLPLFLFVPDTPRRMALTQALKAGTGHLLSSLRALPGRGPVFRFLIARMLYQDGLNALFAFGGIYAAGTFGWSTVELGIFGIAITLTATIGAFAGGPADDRFGPRRVLLMTLTLLLVFGALILSMDETSVFWIVTTAPDGTGLFATLPEKLYLGIALVLGSLLGPIQAASRSYLGRMAEPNERGELFGLYAFTGKVTAFAAPLMVGIVTGATDSQRVGISVVLVFIAAGLALLLTVPANVRATGRSSIMRLD